MIQTPVEHVVWDWNGTLLDDAPACVEAINAMLARRGLPCIDLACYAETFTFPVRRYYEALGFDLAREDWDAMAVEFHDHYARTSRGCVLCPGAADTLALIRGAGIPMSILSASEQSILDRMLAARGLAAYFVSVSGLSNLHAASKLELGRGLTARLGCAAPRVLLIGDTLHDHEVAAALGWQCVLVEGGHQSPRRLRTSAHAVVRNQAELRQVLTSSGGFETIGPIFDAATAARKGTWTSVGGLTP